jgi:hypothetical protein
LRRLIEMEEGKTKMNLLEKTIKTFEEAEP